MKIALIQLTVGPNKSENIARAAKLIRNAVQEGALIISLPECFNSPYGTNFFAKYAEPIPGQSTNMLSSLAKELKVFIVGGSIPEEDGGKVYNTCAVFSPDGEMVAKHRKVHLADIDIPGKIKNSESDVFSPGDQLTSFDTRCKLLLYPSVFNMITGPAHWELLIRSKALNNQVTVAASCNAISDTEVYVAGINPARDETASVVSWGHSMVASPWGDIIAQCENQEEIIFAEIDLNFLANVRSQIPLTSKKRHDVYHTIEKQQS